MILILAFREQADQHKTNGASEEGEVQEIYV
jgi:hypothetical protein